MRWPFRRSGEPSVRLPHAWPMPPPAESSTATTSDDDFAAFLALGFACSQCGREDLPPVGGWDPPICLECDAAINFDAEVAAGTFDEELGLA